MLKQIAFFTSVLISALSVHAQTTILDEDFQQGIPANWTVIKADSYIEQNSQYAPGWIAIPDPNNLSDTVAAATSYFTVAGKASRWLISPAITIGTFGNYLKWRAKSFDPSYPDTYQVLVSKTDTQIASFTDTISRVEFELEDWTNHEVNLTAQGYVNVETIYLAFKIETTGGFNLFLDSINFRKDDPLTVNEQFIQADVAIYPNPTTDLISFSTSAVLDEISIYNTAGNLIYTQASDLPISMQTMNQGLYLVRIRTNTGQLITKRIQKI
ncbi:T9SS-dependent choice-of-anchor J family protein [Fluviicola taffensis]|uniref:Cleaved adhesin domain protein n=1 Tax=Fluviicola taffensis (strain DSM 16823 / NCIMB 13979 / RW262) TaxID=755732 RepID=F2ICG6_FLUTR|nr:choice-of-anchor J domain-containing protein [Fluviicola taffensis]AEA45436.1 Cleaved adhesin domain protein [Fluviicola taffensis DSM 16823]